MASSTKQPKRQGAQSKRSLIKVSHAGVNENCHKWQGHLNPHNRQILATPRVFVVYWDTLFMSDAQAVTFMNQFFTDLFASAWMSGLAQYGIQPATLAGSVVITDTSIPAKMSRDDVETHLKDWLDKGLIPIKPTDREKSLLYVLLTPSTTELTLDGLSSNTDFCGYHQWSFYNKSSIFGITNLFWAVLPTPSTVDLNSLADSLTPCLCHEMAEAFTDRDYNGFQNPNGCEIGDICETRMFSRLGHWLVEPYWSDQDQRCIPSKEISATWLDMGQNTDDRLEAFVIGTDSAIYHNWQTSVNGGWFGWNRLL